MQKGFGYVQDVCADLNSGAITSIIVPGSNKIINLFTNSNDIIIPWEKVKCIGDEIILVEIPEYSFEMQQKFQKKLNEQ